MRRIPLSLILAGTLCATPIGCKPDHAERSASQLDEHTGPASHQTKDAPSAEPELPIPGKSVPLAARPVVVCFGDSLTAGYGADDGASYPDYLQKDLDRDGYQYRVVNEGVSGNTTKDGVDRIDTVLALKPALVVLEFGGNDGLRGLKVATTRTNLATMITRLKAAQIPTVLAGITLPPDYGPDYIKGFTANYTGLARQFNLPLLPFLLKDVYGVDGLMQADNTHATDAGNEVVARNVLTYVEQMLHK